MKQMLVLVLALCCLVNPVQAQLPSVRVSEAIPRDVREIYDRGLAYLVSTQSEDGSWAGHGENGPGVTGMALMVLLASGEDPNFGQYSNQIRKGLRHMISQQSADTGILGNSMYHHGFAMLALAEAYGAVDDRNWQAAGDSKTRSIGQALELAVRGAVTSQKKNPLGAWRYSPDSKDADTSVSGAVLVGLLAARNAGIEVPDESIDKAINYYTKMTSTAGQVGYSGGLGGFGESIPRTSIATLVFAVARRKDLPQFKAAINNLSQNLERQEQHYAEYGRYYQAQALFQGDVAAWEKWNKLLVKQLKASQAADGSFSSNFGTTVGTSLNLLALALNYRFLPIYER
ncbi:MAG: hypothetical protein JWN70_1019 [Planctomycetaceae bacterium]|nr:hypothetical protein [Planctomycetaceae bacterium]